MLRALQNFTIFIPFSVFLLSLLSSFSFSNLFSYIFLLADFRIQGTFVTPMRYLCCVKSNQTTIASKEGHEANQCMGRRHQNTTGKNAYCHIQHASLWHEANSCKHVAHIFEQIHVSMLLISFQILHSWWIATADMTLEGYKSFLEFVWWLFLANLLHVTLLLYWDFVFSGDLVL